MADRKQVLIMVQDPICGMNVNEQTSLSAEKDGQTFYFCSDHCRNKFIQQHHLEGKVDGASCHTKRSVFQNKTLIVSLILLSLVGLSNIFTGLVPFRHAIFMYFQKIWWAILLGLILGGVLDYYVPKEYVSKILAKKDKRTIFHSVLLGFFMSVCSHGILALAIQLHKKGASTPAVVAFLLASPWANLPLTLMLVGFFGLIKALYIICAALIIAVVTGMIFQLLETKNLVEENRNSLEIKTDFSIIQDLKRRFREYKMTFNQAKRDIKGIWQGSVALSNMVLWWILIGMGLASLAGAYIPTEFFQQYMGPSVWGIIVTLLVATIMEVCSEGTAPLAFEIFRQTGALGNSFVFLMAGVATDYTEIGLLWHNVGKKTAIWLPAITVPQVIFWGIVANAIF